MFSGISELYLNGDIIGSDSIKTDVFSNKHSIVYLGQPNNVSNYFFNGYIDDLRVHARVLDTSEIQKLFHEDPYSHKITFKVLYDGNPLDYALITIGDSTRITDDNGTAEFLLENKKYDLNVSAANFNTLNTQVDVDVLIDTINVILPKNTPVNTIKPLNTIIYPNPANSLINIKVNSGDYADILILSTDGKILIAKKISGIESIDISDLIVGIYLVQIKTENNILSKYLLKH